MNDSNENYFPVDIEGLKFSSEIITKAVFYPETNQMCLLIGEETEITFKTTHPKKTLRMLIRTVTTPDDDVDAVEKEISRVTRILMTREECRAYEMMYSTNPLRCAVHTKSSWNEDSNTCSKIREDVTVVVGNLWGEQS